MQSKPTRLHGPNGLSSDTWPAGLPFGVVLAGLSVGVPDIRGALNIGALGVDELPGERMVSAAGGEDKGETTG